MSGTMPWSALSFLPSPARRMRSRMPMRGPSLPPALVGASAVGGRRRRRATPSGRDRGRGRGPLELGLAMPGSPRTRPAPPRWRRPARARRPPRSVAPVVTTSSMTQDAPRGDSGGPGTSAPAAEHGDRARSGDRRHRRARAGAGTARPAGGRRGGRRARPGRSRARCRRRRLVGAHVTMSTADRPRSTRLTNNPARCPATARRLRYLKPSSTSRTRPENGAATTTPSGASGRARLTRANRQVRQIGAPGSRSRRSGS